MAESVEDDITNRFQKVLDEVEERVEILREKALFVQNEKEDLLAILQDVQDNSVHDSLTEADREDVEFNTERLIIRCLTVEASVSTPRNESQEEAFNTVTKILEQLTIDCKGDPDKNFEKIESYLNASLPEPLSAPIDTRFQSKLLGCTVDDQKNFRKKLHSLHQLTKRQLCSNEKSECDICS